MNPDEVAGKWAAFVRGELPEGDYIATIEAGRILEIAERDLLNAWLHLHAHSIITDYLRSIRSSDRARAARVIARGAFAEAAERFEAGEEDALDIFSVRYVIDAEDTTRPLGDMTADDLLYSADYYHGQAKAHLMQEAFLRELAKRVKKGKTVRECVTVAQLSALQGAA